MNLNLPYQVRAGLYVLIAVGGPIVGYLLSKNTIGELEFNLWTGITTVVGTLAALNASPSVQEKAEKAKTNSEDLKG